MLLIFALVCILTFALGEVLYAVASGSDEAYASVVSDQFRKIIFEILTKIDNLDLIGTIATYGNENVGPWMLDFSWFSGFAIILIYLIRERQKLRSIFR